MRSLASSRFTAHDVAGDLTSDSASVSVEVPTLDNVKIHNGVADDPLEIDSTAGVFIRSVINASHAIHNPENFDMGILLSKRKPAGTLFLVPRVTPAPARENGDDAGAVILCWRRLFRRIQRI